MPVNRCIIIFTFVACVGGSEEDSWPVSRISKQYGHYPHIHCHITNVMLRPEQEKGVFYTKNDIKLSDCAPTQKIWHFGVDYNISTSQCSRKFDIGHVVLIYYIYRSSNYFHIHWDTAIPLYKSLYYNSEGHINKTVAVLPSVESSRLQEIIWQTDAFSGERRYRYWNEILESITGDYAYIPLDDNLLQSGQTICFSQLYLGTAQWKITEQDVIQSYVKHMTTLLDITTPSVTEDRIGIISRRNRRKILNEEELVSAVENLAPTELIHFEKLTYKQQVELMQNYTVVAGMNGAGLMNCVYLPPTSTCIQLVPYDAQHHLNFEQYGKFLQARGPYVEWHNTHVNLHVANRSPHDADTTVDVSEFVDVVKEALRLARNAHQESAGTDKKGSHAEL